ncbi:MAG: type II toxin-antitoxin system VapC family toxin [Methyloglobulus sp.]|nr:type II toxin-antitoxin system VapC family toxin [Methyloglobulus sp.]
MEQPQYLMDSNVVIDYLGKKLPAAGMDFINCVMDATPNVSVVTKIEVLGFNAPDEHQQLLANFMDDATVLDLTNGVVDLTIGLRKQNKIRLPDAIIAATALAHGLGLITRNTDDFKNIQGLQLVDPHNL